MHLTVHVDVAIQNIYMYITDMYNVYYKNSDCRSDYSNCITEK